MSVIPNDMSGVCYICGRWGPTEVHHMMHGTANRKKADKYGLTVNLCHECHMRLHDHNEYDREMMRTAQEVFEKYHGHDLWMKEFGKNYVD